MYLPSCGHNKARLVVKGFWRTWKSLNGVAPDGP
jgi:hypothetical protein